MEKGKELVGGLGKCEPEEIEQNKDKVNPKRYPGRGRGKGLGLGRGRGLGRQRWFRDNQDEAGGEIIEE